MNEHPKELLSRYDRLPADDRARIEAARHLETCADCRDELEAFRAIDAAIVEPSDRPPGFDDLCDRLTGVARATRRWTVLVAVLAVVQIVAALVVLFVLDWEPLVTGMVAGILLSDAMLMGALALVGRGKSDRYEEIAGSWSTCRSAWQSHLAADARASRVAGITSLLLLILGAITLPMGFERGVPLHIASGVVLLAVGGFGAVVHFQRRRRARRELDAFGELYPEDAVC